VFARVAAMALLALACAACANEGTGTSFGYRDGAMHVISSASASELSVLRAQKSMAAKVLSSIAYEKVTGSSTDPGRLGE